MESALQEVLAISRTDIEQVFADYIFLALQIGIGMLVGELIVRCIYRKIRKKKYEKKPLFGFKDIIYFLLVVYLVVVAQIAFFSREPGSRDGIDMTLFGTWSDSARNRAYVLENIIMFIPLGLGLSGLLGAYRHLTPFLGLFFSIGIELMQLYSKRGYCQLDDVIMNLAGTVIGYTVYMVFWGIFSLPGFIKNKIKKKEKLSSDEKSVL